MLLEQNDVTQVMKDVDKMVNLMTVFQKVNRYQKLQIELRMLYK